VFCEYDAAISVHPDAEDLAEIAHLIDAGTIVTKVLPLSDAIAAQQAATHTPAERLYFGLRTNREIKCSGGRQLTSLLLGKRQHDFAEARVGFHTLMRVADFICWIDSVDDRTNRAA
jgi:hypothetical protein